MRKLSEYLGESRRPERGYVEVYLHYSHHSTVPVEAPKDAFDWAKENLLQEALRSAMAELEFRYNKPGYRFYTLCGRRLIPEPLMPEDAVYLHPAAVVDIMVGLPRTGVGWMTVPGEKL